MRLSQFVACGALAAVFVGAAAASPAGAARWGRYRRAPHANAAQAKSAVATGGQVTTAKAAAGGQATAPGPLGLNNGFNAGNSGSGWNRNNTWFDFPQYGNYAPPPYATSRHSLIQIGPMPAFGGVRSLPGWGGAR